MPYKRLGRKIYHFKDGIWSVKQVAHSEKNAKKTIHLLYMIEKMNR